MSTRNWLVDFEIGPGAVRVKKTGARIALDEAFFRAGAAWHRYFFAVLAEWPKPKTPTFTIAFLPDRPRPWYLIWPVLRACGAAIVDSPTKADVVFHFEDAVLSDMLPPTMKPGARAVNFTARDISKTAVQTAFLDTFGYALAVDPASHGGPMVEKSERNGFHDGRIVIGPCARRDNHVYQRVVENLAADGMMEDLRTVIVGGRPACIFIKRRSPDKRFTNDNATCSLETPEQRFSPDEIERISAFASRLGLDWGGLDVLRDAGEGRIYIVDANKTDMGPPTALPFEDKLRATRILARELRRFVVTSD